MLSAEQETHTQNVFHIAWRLLDENARVKKRNESLREERQRSENPAQRAWMKEETVATNFPFTYIIFPNIMLSHILFVTIRNSFV